MDNDNIFFKRNSIFLLPYLLFVFSRQYIVFFTIIFSIPDKYKESVFFKVVIIYAIFMIVFNVFKIFIDWITFKYFIDDKAIYVQSGLLFKKKIKLSFDKIQNVMENTPFTFKIFKRTSLKIDLGVNTDDGKIELKMITKDECNDILEKITLLSKKEEDKDKTNDRYEENNIIYKVTNKEILIMSITSLKLILFIPFLMSLYSNISEYFTTDLIDKYIDKLMELTILSVVFLLVIFFFSLIYGYIITYIRFGKFSVFKGNNKNNLYIKSGFINLKVKSIPIDKIVTLNFTTNILFDYLKYHKVKAITLGEQFNMETNNDLLFPFIKKERTKSLLIKIIPDFLDEIDLKKLPYKSWVLNAIFYCPFIIIFVVLLNSNYSFYWLFLLMIFLLLYQCFKQSKKEYRFNCNEKTMKLKFGFLVKKTYITNFNNIEQIVIKQGILQRTFGTCNLTVFIKTNQTKGFKIQNIPYDDCKEMYNSLVSMYQ